MAKLIWTPQPKQAMFMSRFEDEALYGGAAGGGKSDTLVIEAMRQVEIPYYRGLLTRRTFPQMEDLMDKSIKYYKKAYPKAKFNDSKHFWRFPSGAKILFGSMPHEKDMYNYQGKPYDFIGVDEMTQFLLTQYEYLISRNRPNGPGTRVYIRGTANPGGVGHGWVKNRFITPTKPGETIWYPVKIRFPDGHQETRWKSRVFIPSSVFDNQKLMENDPDYIARLASLPEAERNALLYGDWNSFQGQVFREWKNDPEHYADRIRTHVINPFTIPNDWRIYRGFDFGYARPFSVGWFAVDHERRMYHIRELYGCTDQPNTGVKWTPQQIAQKIKEIEATDPNLMGRRVIGIADPSIYDESRGESIARMMEREGVYFQPGDNKRLPGKMEMHYRMAFDDRGWPMLYVFSTCKHFRRTVPNLTYDEVDPEDVDTDGEDHIYDMTRYVAMENPIAPAPVKERAAKAYNPLDDDIPSYDRYDFYNIRV